MSSQGKRQRRTHDDEYITEDVKDDGDIFQSLDAVVMGGTQPTLPNPSNSSNPISGISLSELTSSLFDIEVKAALQADPIDEESSNFTIKAFGKSLLEDRRREKVFSVDRNQQEASEHEMTYAILSYLNQLEGPYPVAGALAEWGSDLIEEQLEGMRGDLRTRTLQGLNLWAKDEQNKIKYKEWLAIALTDEEDAIDEEDAEKAMKNEDSEDSDGDSTHTAIRRITFEGIG